ncbi:MAG: alpha/beta fold hydrolase [Actinomycetota bacterium]
MTPDDSDVLLPGPWRHRFVSANGARFHIAEAVPPDPQSIIAESAQDRGMDAPLVVLLHGFPQMWWCWRAQLPALAAAGYRTVAMDLRGYGASDKPPGGYDTPTLAADVAAVIRSLGAQDAVIVGHDWGGWISWAMPNLQPQVTRAVAALSIAHPLAYRRATRRSLAQRRASGYVLGFQLPLLPERFLARPGALKTMLRHGSGTSWPDDTNPGREAIEVYANALRIPFVAHSAMEYYRWAMRSAIRPDGRAFIERIRTPITVPVLQMHGREDRAVLTATARYSRRWVTGPYRWVELPQAGHFIPEERPDDVTRVLLDWLPTVTKPRTDQYSLGSPPSEPH